MEALQAREAHRHEARCPFCHDVFSESSEPADARVACSACGAPHHAECYVENGGCAVMGCGSRAARTSGASEPVAVETIAENVGATVRPTPPGWMIERWLLLGLSVCLLLGTLTWPGFDRSGIAGRFVAVFAILGAIASGICLTLVLMGRLLELTVSRAVAARRESEARNPLPPVAVPRTDPYDIYSPTDALRRALGAEGSPASGAIPVPRRGPLPERCPSCGERLEAEEGREARAPFPFCYHCGAALD